MFRVAQAFVAHGTYEYPSPESAGEAPLPRRLFGLDGVVQVLVTSRFVTVNKDPVYAWPELVPSIKSLIREHLDSGDPAVPAGAEGPSGVDIDSPIAAAVSQLIDDEIRPAVAMDGGDVQFIGLTDEMVVQVRLIGACASCPSSTATLSMGIERLIIEEFPQVVGVEQVA